MALRDWFTGLIGRRREAMVAKFLDGTMPVFSQFGQDIYASDLVQMAVDAIATEVSKLQPKHIRVDAEEMQTVPQSALNRLFKFSPNPLMTTKDFLEKIVWLLYRNYNVFIYPMYDVATDSRGAQTREYRALYPLDPVLATFLQDSTGRLFVEFAFASSDKITVPYADIIHLRKRFSANTVMGGGLNGQPDNRALLKVLTVNDTILQGLDKAVRATLGVRGILSMNTMMDADKLRAEREKFEQAIAESKTGILAMDLKGAYTDLKPDPRVIDRDTLAFIQERILNWYGVPLKILSGAFGDDDYQAFYERTLEPLLIGLAQAFSRCLFTDRELQVGNEVVFYHRDMMYLSTASKLKLLDTAGAQGLLTDDQKLRVLGYPPLLDGSGGRRTISLNYVSTDIADQYQMARARAGLRSPIVPGQPDEEPAAGQDGEE